MRHFCKFSSIISQTELQSGILKWDSESFLEGHLMRHLHKFGQCCSTSFLMDLSRPFKLYFNGPLCYLLEKQSQVQITSLDDETIIKFPSYTNGIFTSKQIICTAINNAFYPHCLKITQNVSFRILAFSPIFVLN